MRFFEVKLQHIIACIPECWRNCLCLEKAGDGLGQLFALLLPTECVQTREMPLRLPKFFLEFMDILSYAGRKILSQTPRRCRFSALIVFSDRDCLQ